MYDYNDTLGTQESYSKAPKKGNIKYYLRNIRNFFIWTFIGFLFFMFWGVCFYLISISFPYGEEYFWRAVIAFSLVGGSIVGLMGTVWNAE